MEPKTNKLKEWLNNEHPIETQKPLTGWLILWKVVIIEVGLFMLLAAIVLAAMLAGATNPALALSVKDRPWGMMAMSVSGVCFIFFGASLRRK